MNCASRILASVLATIATLAGVAPVAHAGGPLAIFDPLTKTPYAYPMGPVVEVRTDLGPLGPLTNPEATGLAGAAYAEWTGVPTSYFAATITGPTLVDGLPTDITAANVDAIIGTFNGGGIDVIFDDDGGIVTGFFGAPPGVLGIGGLDFLDPGGPIILESWIVLNGLKVSGADVGGVEFGGVFTHEAGHSINLGHSQTNGGVIFSMGLDPDTPFGCPPEEWTGTGTVDFIETMYPFTDVTPPGSGAFQATVDMLDDVVAVSTIHPDGGWPGGLGTITGKVFYPDGVTEATGVNVIARNATAPVTAFIEAASAISGDFTQGKLGPDGSYTLKGLTPGAPYVLYVDVLTPTASFSTPAIGFFPGDEEWWDAGESAFDDPCTKTTITLVPDVPFVADFILNAPTCVQARCPGDTVLAPGTTVTLDYCILNCGPTTATIDYVLTDDLGWCSAPAGPVVVPSGTTVCIPVTCTVPSGAAGGTLNTITWKATTLDTPSVSDSCVTSILADGLVPITVEDFVAEAVEGGVRLQWSMGADWRTELAGVHVQRAPDREGPYAGLTAQALPPQAHMDFVDDQTEPGTPYWYRLLVESLEGDVAIVGPVRVAAFDPGSRSTTLRTPFVPAAGPVQIRYAIGGGAAHTRVGIFDVRGRRVRLLDRALRRPGEYLLTWDRRTDAGTRTARGLYLVKLEAAGRVFSKKMVLVR